jgi:hypothetical protein
MIQSYGIGYCVALMVLKKQHWKLVINASDTINTSWLGMV